VPSQPVKTLKTWTGSFGTIRLDFKPEPPEPKENWSQHIANYSVELAYLHIFLDGQIAIERLPSANFCPLLEGLFEAIPTLINGGTASAHWFSDPWQFDLRGVPVHNRVYITLHVPGRWTAMQDVNVPLNLFGREVIQVGRRWLRYLDSIYHEEIIDPNWGQQYRQLGDHLNSAQKALKEYGAP
jgi:hypothetical protein